MLYRSLYATAIGSGSALLVVAAMLPWVQISSTGVGPTDVVTGSFSVSGIQAGVGRAACLIALALLALAVWFWGDTNATRVRFASMLLVVIAAIPLMLAVWTLTDAGRFFPHRIAPIAQPSVHPHYGLYLTAAVSTLVLAASLAALLRYDLQADRPAPRFVAIGRPGLVGLLAGVYLSLFAWRSLGQPFPSVAIPTGGSSMRPLEPGFFSIAFVAVLSLCIGVAARSVGRGSMRVPLAANLLVIALYAAAVIGLSPLLSSGGAGIYLGHFGYDDEYTSEEFKRMYLVIAGFTATIATMSLWGGVSLAESIRVLRAWQRERWAQPEDR